MKSIETKVTTALFRAMRVKGICPINTDFEVDVNRDNKVYLSIESIGRMQLGGIGMSMNVIYTRIERVLDWYLNDLSESKLAI